MTKKPKITLQFLADKLNVTKVTISKALRNHPDISAQTIALVKKTADELGYIPNLAARNLSSRKTNTIGVIIPKVAHSFYPSLVDSIYKYAAANNYEIILTVSQENTELEKKHLTTMLSMKVDGIIAAVTNSTDNKSLFEVVENHNIPLIEIDRTISNNFTRILFDDVKGTYKAVKYALCHGYKRPAFVGGNHKLHIGRDRLKGFKKALAESEIPLDKYFITEGGFNERVGYDAIMKFNQDKKMPDFIFAVTYPIALGIHEAARELGIKIPNKLDVISFGDSFFNKYLFPPVNCIYQDTDKMAKIAISEVIEAINQGDKYNPKTITIESEIKYDKKC